MQSILILRSLLLNFFRIYRSLWTLSLCINKLLNLSGNWLHILVLKSLPINFLILILKLNSLQILNWIIVIYCIIIILKSSGNIFFWNVIILLVYNIRIIRASSIRVEHRSISKLSSILAWADLIHLIDTPRRCIVVWV